MKNLLFLCGGQSPEHEISIRSTRNILNALSKTKYQVTLIGITQEGAWRLIKPEEMRESIDDQGKPVALIPGSQEPFECDGESLGTFDVIFPILHGPNGEDGTVQGLFRLLNIPFVGPDVASSSASMDKDMTKRLLRDAGIKVADWLLIRKGESIPNYNQVKDQLGEIVFVKPANMGSSVGVHRVSSSSEWQRAIEDAFIFDRKVLVEREIKGKELECAVLGNIKPEATGVGEVQSGQFYSYDKKYDAASEAKIVIPADVDANHLPQLKETAMAAYTALNCEVMSRVDMFLTSDGEVLVNEINTIPGFTSISMYPKLWEEAGLDYADLLDRLIELAIERG